MTQVEHTPGPWTAVLCRITDNAPIFGFRVTALINHDRDAEFDWHSSQIAQAEAAIAKAEQGQ